MPYLPLTVDSVLRQTLADWEMVIVDDCSTDGTADYLATLNDPRIRIVRNEQNLGAAATWTRSLDLATTAYVKLLCHDDLIAPTCLAEQLRALQAMPDASLCTCWRDVINARGDVLMSRRVLPGGFHSGDVLIRNMVTRGQNTLGEPSAGLFPRALWEKVRPYSPDNLYMIDVSLWVKLLRFGGAVVVPKPLCSFRISPTSLSARLARRQGHDARRFFRQVARDHGIGRLRLASGLVRTTLSAVARQLVFSRQRGD